MDASGKHILKSTGQPIRLMPWPDSVPGNPAPHCVRILVPYTATQLRNSKGKCAHVQFVRRDSIKQVA